MRISLLDAKATRRKLTALIKKHKHIKIAVAWGGITPVAETLLDNKSKFDSLLLGLDFSATDPELIDRLVDVPNAFVTKNRPGLGCFHPKIFYFETGPKAEAIIGSANFTKGGLCTNIEACVHAKGAASKPFFRQVRKQLKGYRDLHLPITKPLAEKYRPYAEQAAKATRPTNPTLPSDIKSPLTTMTWKKFAKSARRDIDERMKLLRKIQKMFDKTDSFGELSVAEWKGIAGALGECEAEGAGLNGFDWGCFGSMHGAGNFTKLIGRRDQRLAKALDIIPICGPVTQTQFEEYVSTFGAAFSDSDDNLGSKGLGSATRLLAMKRPDVFVCVNGGNRAGLEKALPDAKVTVKLDNYWEKVIQPIQQALWFTEPRPNDRHMGKLWDARVAMLDAVYYKPERV